MLLLEIHSELTLRLFKLRRLMQVLAPQITHSQVVERDCTSHFACLAGWIAAEFHFGKQLPSFFRARAALSGLPSGSLRIASGFVRYCKGEAGHLILSATRGLTTSSMILADPAGSRPSNEISCQLCESGCQLLELQVRVGARSSPPVYECPNRGLDEFPAAHPFLRRSVNDLSADVAVASPTQQAKFADYGLDLPARLRPAGAKPGHERLCSTERSTGRRQ